MANIRYTLVLGAVSFSLMGQPALKPGFDVNSIDKSVAPCNDFFQYACGNWLKVNPIPADQSRWDRFTVLRERNLTILKDILETSEAKKTRTPVEQKIGDYYEACMDEAGVEAKGIKPLKPELDRIAAISSKAALVDEVSRLHKSGVSSMFRFGSGQDYKKSTDVIAQADQGGLSLPDRDYYLKTDPKSGELRDKYVEHVQKMFQLLGDPENKAAAKAKAVLNIETELAKGSLDRVSRRDPNKNYHKMTTAQLAELAPSFDWNKYLVERGIPQVKSLNVGVPDFFKRLNETLDKTSLDDWKTYLTWHYVHSVAEDLPKAFVQENFNFFSHTLAGVQEMRPRWKRCVSSVDSDLPEALGQKYVELTFGREGKDRTLKMVGEIEAAMQKDINALTWMTPATKKRALEKLHMVANKIGYPDKWKDYSAVDIQKSDLLGNDLRSNAFNVQYQLAKIGKPVDNKEWFMSPPTVNAYYNPPQNNINFPAGILQPPFFDAKLDDAVNYGAVGAVVGHELTHGFDDQGRQFDGNGNLEDWWTPEDAAEFKRRAECIDKEYSEFVATDDVHLNGKLTLGENAADNGGLHLAYMALMDDLAGKTQPKIDGYTPEQRFFLGWAQIWCSKATPERLRMNAQNDPHSPGKYRTNGTVSNSPEFQKAFSCKAGDPMVRADACRVW
jgi:putative endopeptidase